jgi:cell division protein FtsB
MDNLFSTLNIVLTLATIVAGLLAYRSSITRAANEVQERVIAALETEITTMRDKLDDMKAENTRLRVTIETICAALRSRGMAVTIDGDMVSIKDSSGSSTTARIMEECA